MRSHFLKDLTLIKGREVILAAHPNFDFYYLVQVKTFCWSTELDETLTSVADLMLTALYQDSRNNTTFDIKIRCLSVKQLILPELGSSFFISEIEIEDVSDDQLEGIKFHIKSYGMSRFVVLCKDISLDYQ